MDRLCMLHAEGNVLFVFYHRGVNSNVISWNRVVLLHGKISCFVTVVLLVIGPNWLKNKSWYLIKKQRHLLWAKK